jgi:hypothetical protein
MDMIAMEMEKKWHELQDRNENIFGRLLRGEIQRIEYKPQYAVPLLMLSSVCREHEFPEIK